MQLVTAANADTADEYYAQSITAANADAADNRGSLLSTLYSLLSTLYSLLSTLYYSPMAPGSPSAMEPTRR